MKYCKVSWSPMFCWRWFFLTNMFEYRCYLLLTKSPFRLQWYISPQTLLTLLTLCKHNIEPGVPHSEVAPLHTCIPCSITIFWSACCLDDRDKGCVRWRLMTSFWCSPHLLPPHPATHTGLVRTKRERSDGRWYLKDIISVQKQLGRFSYASSLMVEENERLETVLWLLLAEIVLSRELRSKIRLTIRRLICEASFYEKE